MTRFDPTREIRAPRGTALNAKSWQTGCTRLGVIRQDCRSTKKVEQR